MTPVEYVRFLAKTIRTDHGCWLWTGAKVRPTASRPHSGGYAIFNAGGRTRLGHRLSYQHHRGEIPPGMTIDHTCHKADGSCPGGITCPHRSCVNPDHLVLASGRENTRRTGNASKDECPKGHPYDEVNTYVDKTGRRHCRQCRRGRTKRWYDEQGGATWHQAYHRNVRRQKE